jgi:hypothetical protein
MNTRVLSFVLLLISFSLFADTTKEPAQNKKDEKDKLIIEIIIPMDAKPENAQMHVSIIYEVCESGRSRSWGEIASWADRAYETFQLTKEQIKKVKEIVDTLPKGKNKEELAPDQLLKVIVYTDDLPKTKIYDRTKLPSQMEELFKLMGGMRSELKDKIGYEAEETGNKKTEKSSD